MQLRWIPSLQNWHCKIHRFNTFNGMPEDRCLDKKHVGANDENNMDCP
jgi:hypothetical protein